MFFLGSWGIITNPTGLRSYNRLQFLDALTKLQWKEKSC